MSGCVYSTYISSYLLKKKYIPKLIRLMKRFSKTKSRFKVPSLFSPALVHWNFRRTANSSFKGVSVEKLIYTGTDKPLKSYYLIVWNLQILFRFHKLLVSLSNWLPLNNEFPPLFLKPKGKHKSNQ